MDEHLPAKTDYADDDVRAIELKQAALADLRVQALTIYLQETIGWHAQSIRCCKFGQTADDTATEIVTIADDMADERTGAAIHYTVDHRARIHGSAARTVRAIRR
jgi:hypothetical protein